MPAKRIVILNGHPGQSSLSKALTAAYGEAATKAGHEVRQHDLSNMDFDIDFGQASFQDTKPLEPDLESFLRDLEWSDHVVLATPVWWGAIPGKLKGMIDRAFLPGRTFNPRKTNFLGLPEPMLKGKTARVLMTSDTPAFYLRLLYDNAVKKFMTRQIFHFVGIKPVSYSQFAPASHAPKETVGKWLATARALGTRGA